MVDLPDPPFMVWTAIRIAGINRRFYANINKIIIFETTGCSGMARMTGIIGIDYTAGWVGCFGIAGIYYALSSISRPGVLLLKYSEQAMFL